LGHDESIKDLGGEVEILRTDLTNTQRLVKKLQEGQRPMPAPMNLEVSLLQKDNDTVTAITPCGFSAVSTTRVSTAAMLSTGSTAGSSAGFAPSTTVPFTPQTKTSPCVLTESTARVSSESNSAQVKKVKVRAVRLLDKKEEKAIRKYISRDLIP
jgi:hypothetical protein